MRITLIVAVVLAANYVVMDLIGAVLMFVKVIYRNPRQARIREYSKNDDDEKKRMYEEGLRWSKQYSEITNQLHVVSDGLNLYGEYVDLGYDKCAIILQGRTESLVYCYYYADIYARCGYNILVVDIRAHGLSDGKYHTSGIRESDDLVVWIDCIRNVYGISNFAIHGICVGGATAIYALFKLRKKGVDVIRRIATDGLFTTNYELFRRNMREYKQPAFPALQICFLMARIMAGVDLFRETPIRYVSAVDIPMLFIWSRVDKYCVPQKGEELFELCGSPTKQIHFFPKGAHSHVRYNQPDEYDTVVAKFLSNEDH